MTALQSIGHRPINPKRRKRQRETRARRVPHQDLYPEWCGLAAAILKGVREDAEELAHPERFKSEAAWRECWADTSGFLEHPRCAALCAELNIDLEAYTQRIKKLLVAANSSAAARWAADQNAEAKER